MVKIANQTHYFKAAARELVENVRGWTSEKDFLLHIDDQQITLCTDIQQQKTCFSHSFSATNLVKRAQQKNQGLLKACNSKKRDIHALTDLTAGWGRDSFILAMHGMKVTQIEHHPLVYACVKYLLDIAPRENNEMLFDRLSIHHMNSIEYLNSINNHKPDCLYLDPMFPAHKSTARPGKELQILQLLTENQDMQQLFELALKKAGRRVVVKRALHAPPMSTRKPDIVYREKSIRFDVYLCAA